MDGKCVCVDNPVGGVCGDMAWWRTSSCPSSELRRALGTFPYIHIMDDLAGNYNWRTAWLDEQASLLLPRERVCCLNKSRQINSYRRCESEGEFPPHKHKNDIFISVEGLCCSMAVSLNP